jgi:hypothetical protein
MRSNTKLPVGVRRRPLTGCGGLFGAVALVAASVIGAHAQTPPEPQQPQPATPQEPSPPAPQPQEPAGASPLAFTGEGGLMFNVIKQGHTADFEAVMERLGEALRQSEEPVRQRQAAGWKVFRSMEPGPEGNVLYIYVVDPAVPETEYDVMKILSEALPHEEVLKLYEQYREAFASLNRVNLQLVQDFSRGAQPAAATQPGTTDGTRTPQPQPYPQPQPPPAPPPQ